MLFPILLAIPAVAGPLPDPLPSPLEAGWQGEEVCELLSENAQLRTLRCTFPPGAGHERHFHAPHWGYAVEGATNRITDANGVREVTTATGGTWWSDGTAWHETLNIGDTTGVFIIVEPKAVRAGN
ncbi:MAG: hypothetical protein Q8R45_07420 [Brevundimonas sp.]|uniref:hypothetical protein n=1 Tax=Brevundimonas sp. TaxID=1871086 RepID=UPI0027340518|nr:hypothetical protein [Brevundimonas sp.]MDP3656775.1 hypothetical protein [Brevundimonas sp.]MDZ4112411.1 hypothetical protein [Brevundimonas sp.]